MSVRYEQAETLLNAIGIYSALAEFDPFFAGTMPIDVDIENSDIDVICEVQEHRKFADILEDGYSDQVEFTLNLPEDEGGFTLCQFQCMSFKIEIFGTNQPVKQQTAWRHMEAERKLLVIGGAQAQERIRLLKQSGLKTEPAFARYFALQGDPYKAVLALSDLTVSEILSEISA